MSENQLQKIVEHNQILYSLNTEGKTASIIGNKLAQGDINIPRSISDESNEYVITSISKDAFKYSEIKSILFASISEIRTIGDDAFSCSTIERFTIPPHITIISNSTFSYCKHIQNIEIPENSELKIIENYAFAFSSIERFTIPPHLTKICGSAFFYCKNLKEIEVPTTSELKTIEVSVFFNTKIEYFTIPSKLVELNDCWCNGIQYVTSFYISPNNPRYSSYENKYIIGKSSIELKNFDVLFFSIRNIKFAEIPNFIKCISSCAFNLCKKLRKVVISENSELEIIECSAFCGSAIESFTIPYHVTQIGESAFSYCKNLRKIEIHKNSKLKKIDKYAFTNSSIESFSIPPHITYVDSISFTLCDKMKIIEIDEDLKVKNIDFSFLLPCKQSLIMIPTKFNELLNPLFNQ